MIDIKQLTVESFADSIEKVNKEENSKVNYRLLIFTSLGIFEGDYKYIDFDTLQNSETGEYDIANVLMGSRFIKINKEIENNPNDEIIQKTRTIVLENVTLHANNNRNVQMPLVTLFSDQIIGVSFGELKYPE